MCAQRENRQIKTRTSLNCTIAWVQAAGENGGSAERCSSGRKRQRTRWIVSKAGRVYDRIQHRAAALTDGSGTGRQAGCSCSFGDGEIQRGRAARIETGVATVICHNWMLAGSKSEDALWSRGVASAVKRKRS